MRRRFLLINVVACFVFSVIVPNKDSFAAITYIQSASKDSGFGITSDTLSFSSNTKPHNTIIVAVRRGGSSGTVTITDSQGNTYTQAATQDRGTDHATFIFYATNIVGGADTVTVTFSVAQSMRTAIHEYSGISPSNPLDKTATATGTSTSPDSGSATTTKPKELIFVASSNDNLVDYTAGTGFTRREQVGGQKLGTEDKVVSSAGANSGTFTISPSDAWTALMATFRDDSPVVWYKFDDGAGTSTTDSSGNGYTGTLGDGVCSAGTGVCPSWTTTGRYKNALDFDQSDDYVNAGDIEAIDGLKAITVMAWIKSSTSGIAATEIHWIDKGTCNGGTNNSVFEFIGGLATNANKASFVVYPTGAIPSAYVSADGVTTIDDTKWHHVAGVYDGSNVYVYVDGRQDGSTSLSSVTLASVSNNLEIGGNCSGHGGYIWGGKIDDVRIYDRALRPAEIRKIFQGGNALRWHED